IGSASPTLTPSCESRSLPPSTKSTRDPTPTSPPSWAVSARPPPGIEPTVPFEEEAMEFLTELVTNVPEGTEEATVEETKAREAKRAAELAAAGHLLRLWKPPAVPGEWRTLGLFSADNEQQLQGILASLPLHVWM